MKWRRRIDYHGFRSYSETQDNALRLDLAVMAGWVKKQLEKLMKAGAPQPDDLRTLIRARERNFSLLGAAANENQRKASSVLWPTVAELTGSHRLGADACRKDVEVGEQPRA